MADTQGHTTLKGNPFWAISYALGSLRNYPVRNAGIALVLAIGIALPTTVFVWTNTGTSIVVTDYFANSPYQLTMTPISGQNYASSRMASAVTFLEANAFISGIQVVPSTIGILQGGSIPKWTSYSRLGLNYRDHIKDMRILLVTNEVIANWTHYLDFAGSTTLARHQVLVSQQFVNYTYQVHNITLKIGDSIDFDLLRYGDRGDDPASPDQLGAVNYYNYIIAGIYTPNTRRSLVAKAFPSMSRKNWDPMSLYQEPVLGIDDSIMMLQSDIAGLMDEVLNRGFFDPVAFVKGSSTALLAAGADRIGENLESVKEQMEETYPNINIEGLSEIWKLDAAVATYLQSQVLTVIALPVLIMSLMLTVFTSETSVSRRRGEISALRSKGASFNQVFSTFMWESIILAVFGFILAIVLTYIMAPLIGSSTGLFQFDPVLYGKYVDSLTFSPVALIIAGFISMYLPASYILHVARRIDVSEVGQPTINLPDEETEESSFMKNVIGLTALLSLLLALPMLLAPVGPVAIGEIIVATLILFAASYLGSRAMRHITARISGSTNFLFGEKALYLSRSLRKRKGQFIPLLVILTLTLTTTTMMLIQSTSFAATLDNEIQYSIGADVRVECDNFPVAFNQSILHQPGIYHVTPVIESWATVGSNKFFVEGVNPLEYAQVGNFVPESFVSGDPQTVLAALAATPNGIVISDYYAQLWNKTVGDLLTVSIATETYYMPIDLEVVGIMQSAPGFGMASTADMSGTSFGSLLGFQIVGEGFALVNLDLLYNQVHLTNARLFLASTVSYANMTKTVSAIENLGEMDVYAPATFDLATESYAIYLFMSGIDGLALIAFLLCAAMGLSAIALFLGSAVMERKMEYAIFRALGGTKRQVVSMVFGEFAGTVIASIAISVILGLFFGYAMSILTFGISPFAPILSEVLSLPILMMTVLILLESVVMIGSCYIPARRAGNVNPATALRNL
ncbi:MAG: FtsX-like permease family protein [Candidatus Thorarchaeota archaeon]|nr:FtsX-like permease family protein [Candidatus Thorarchaeota archaeon]